MEIGVFDYYGRHGLKMLGVGEVGKAHFEQVTLRGIVVASGNHDFWAADPRVTTDVYAERRWLRTLVGRTSHGRRRILAGDGDAINFKGLKIAVHGWLQVPDQHDQVDILVLHAPPMGRPYASGVEGRHNGDPELFPAVQFHPPTLVLSGHIHAPRKYLCMWPPLDPATLVLVPGCDEEAETPNHWIIDTVAGTARHNGGAIVRILVP